MARFEVRHDGERFEYGELRLAQDYFFGCVRDRETEWSTEVVLIADENVIAIYDSRGIDDRCGTCGLAVDPQADACANCG